MTREILFKHKGEKFCWGVHYRYNEDYVCVTKTTSPAMSQFP